VMEYEEVADVSAKINKILSSLPVGVLAIVDCEECEVRLEKANKRLCFGFEDMRKDFESVMRKVQRL